MKENYEKINQLLCESSSLHNRVIGNLEKENHQLKITIDSLQQKQKEDLVVIGDLDKQIAGIKEQLSESEFVRESLAKIIGETTLALKGEQLSLQKHSWHDISEVAVNIVKENSELKTHYDAYYHLQSDYKKLENYNDQLKSENLLYKKDHERLGFVLSHTICFQIVGGIWYAIYNGNYVSTGDTKIEALDNTMEKLK